MSKYYLLAKWTKVTHKWLFERVRWLQLLCDKQNCGPYDMSHQKHIIQVIIITLCNTQTGKNLFLVSYVLKFKICNRFLMTLLHCPDSYTHFQKSCLIFARQKLTFDGTQCYILINIINYMAERQTSNFTIINILRKFNAIMNNDYINK